MKKLLTLLLFLTASTVSFAQDPDVGGTILNGTGVPSGNPTGSPFAPGEALSFAIDAGSASGDLTFPPPGGAEFQVNITVRGMGIPTVSVANGFVNYFGVPEINPLGNGVYEIILSQNQAILEGQYTRFSITGIASGPNGTVVQYQANGNPGGYNTTNVGTDSPSSTGVVETALPVTLTSFTAAKEGQTALLKWATTMETNSDRFEIQRSQNGKQWGMIGTKQSNGESSSLKSYNFTDSEPLDGENLYRLKMIDRDGTFAYSRIESLTFEGLTTSFYPNPVADKLVISAGDFSKVKNVQIYDASGKTVYKSSATPSAEINVQSLSAGLYVVQMVRKNGTVVTQKIIKQ